MEHTNNNDETRGRARRGRGVRSRSSMAGHSGVRGRRTHGTHGGQCGHYVGGRLPNRLSGSERVFCDMMENLPKCQPLVTRLHTKKVKVSPAKVPKNPRYVECGESSCTSTSMTKQSVSPGVGDASPKKRPHLTPSSSGRPVSSGEISTIHNYGSGEESDEEEEGLTQSLVIPRVARMFMPEEVEEGCLKINLEWPPKLPKPSNCASTPASLTPVSMTHMEPSNKFKFDWRTFSGPQIEPHLRRERFSQIKRGPTVTFTNPYKAFIAIWDREIMEFIVRETNIYAQQLLTTMSGNVTTRPSSRITHWRDTDVNELYKYLAITLAMGVVVKSEMAEYWNTPEDIFSTPGFSTEMTFDRYQLLSKCLHFNNNDDCVSASLTQSQAKLFKIKPLIDHFNRKFSQLYNLSQNVALDDSLTMRTGLPDVNQFIPNKAATVGIKTYEVCESQTGYLWRFEVHAGHDTSALRVDDPLSGIVPALVLRLLNGLEHKGHTIWMDNFYSSPALARELKVLGFDCVGTVQANCQFLPPDLANIKENMKVGQVMGCTSGDVDLMVWRDKKCVTFISTYHGLATTRCGDTLMPTVVQDYNVCMASVDRKDQQLSMYPIERSKVWYKKIFRRLLNVSVLNSHILLKNQSQTHRKFREVLIADLLTAHRTPAPTPEITTVVHIPAQYQLIKPGSTNRRKRKCVVCRKRTITYCKTCNVAICLFTCFEPYHISHCD